MFLIVPAVVQANGLVPCGLGPTTLEDGTLNPAFKACTVCDFYKLIQNIINFLLYVFASLATLAAVYIAFLFMFSGGSPAKITEAKGKLWMVLKGILWVLGSWLVLSTIINFITVIGKPGKFPLPWNQINCEVSRPTLLFSPPPGANVELDILGANNNLGSGERLGEEAARDKVQQAGIAVNLTNPCYGVDFHKVPGGCTTLEGVKASTIEKAIQLKNDCECAIKITGGAEPGHAEDKSGRGSHATGDKLDFEANQKLNAYIEREFRYSGLRSDGAEQYVAPDGSLYAREFDHWDVTFTGL